jgi:hypothetical protein
MKISSKDQIMLSHCSTQATHNLPISPIMRSLTG